MKPRLIPLLFALCMASVSCVQEDEHPDTPEGNLQALWEIIDQHYCFLDYKSQSIGLDWSRVGAQYRSRLNPQMSSPQLFEVLTEMLSHLQDGHVNLFSSIDMGRNWSWKDDHPAQLDHELRDRYLGTAYRIAGGIKYRILPDNIAYAVYESFTDGIGEGNLDDMLFYLRLCDGLILDLRGNGGGTLTYAQRLAQRFTNQKRLVGYISHKTGPGHSDFSRPEAQYIEPSHGVRWQKPVVVLTNRQCYSATNTFVRDMQVMPLVTTLGDQTGGGSGLPFNSELPNGWGVRFSACPMFDAQMRQIEFGIAPDIPVALDSADVAHGHDTLIEAARKELKKK